MDSCLNLLVNSFICDYIRNVDIGGILKIFVSFRMAVTIN